MKNLGLLLLLISISSFAKGEFPFSIKGQPNATKWEVLKDYFHRANSPAELSDFYTLDEGSNQECRYSFPKVSDLSRVWIVKTVRTTNRDDGPLFPEESIAKLHLTFFSNARNKAGHSNNFDYTTMTSTPYALNVNKTSRYLTSSPYFLRLKKDSLYIFFKLILPISSLVKEPIETLEDDQIYTLYGYCWRSHL